jgi:hypothetical protein
VAVHEVDEEGEEGVDAVVEEVVVVDVEEGVVVVGQHLPLLPILVRRMLI